VLAARYDLPVIEDATEALGALYKGKMVGSEGHIACFSFNGNKIITTGGGGMIVTNDPRLADHAKYLTTQAKDDPVEYVHGEVGFNYRLTNVLAAIGCAQMEQLPDYVKAKKRIAARYETAFSSVPGITPMQHANYADPTFWLYTIAIEGGSRDVMHRLTAEGIQSRPLWRPMHMLPTFKNIIDGEYPVAEQLNKNCLSIPCSVGLTEEQQTKVIEALKEVAATISTKVTSD
jgi:perosamine synthetase